MLTLSVSDSWDAPDDATVQFGTPLSAWRIGASDSPLVRPTFPDATQFIEITNSGVLPRTLEETRVNAPGVSVSPHLTDDPADNIELAPGQTQRFELTFTADLPTLTQPVTTAFDIAGGVEIQVGGGEPETLRVRLIGRSTFHADITYDGVVDLAELGVLNVQFGRHCGDAGWDPSADLDGDGAVNLSDLGLLNAQFGRNGIGPVITAALANDTGSGGKDGITGDPTITGSVTDNRGVTTFSAGFNHASLDRYTDLLGDLQPDGSFILSPTRLAEIYGGPLPEGDHTLHLRAVDTDGNLFQRYDVAFTYLTGTPVVFADPQLAVAVRRQLGLPSGKVITTGDMEQLTELIADSNVVSALGGMEHAVNLRSFTLRPGDYSISGSLNDLTPLESLSNLTSLALIRAGLNDAEVATFSPLAVLESLDLRYNDLTAVPSLDGWHNLHSLYVYGNPIEATSAVAGSLVRTDLVPEGLYHAETVAELAAALHYQPLQLFEHVLNRFEYQPYAGSMKGAQAVLETGAGNDWDQARLLAELMDEAGLATRYVFGQIEVDVPTVQDWLGVTHVDAARRVLANADLNPVRNLDGAGQVISFSFDHAWLEVLLDLPAEGPQWVEFDPSWKFKDYQPGIGDILVNVPFDEAGYLSQVRLETAAEYYANQVFEYLTQNDGDKSLADVPYDGPILVQTIDAVPDGLPYAVVGVPDVRTEVPESMTHRVDVIVRQSGVDLITERIVLPEMGLQRLTLDLPGTGPVLRLEGNPIAEGAPLSALADVEIILRHFDAGDDAWDESCTYVRQVDDYVAIGLDANQISDAMLRRQRETVNRENLAGLNGELMWRDGAIGAALAMGILGFFHQANAAEALIDGLTHAVPVYTHVASGLATSQRVADIYEDLVLPVVPRGAGVDVGSNFHRSNSLDGNTAVEAARNRIVNLDGSAQEHAVWEELINTESISTIKSLQLAHERGNPVFEIDSTNAAILIPQLTHPSWTIQDIQAEVSSGATVTVPRDPTPLNRWNGVGYIVDHPSSIAFIIYGGLHSQQPSRVAGGKATGDPNRPPANNKGNNTNQTHTGDPVNVANGNVIRDETDIHLPAIGIPLEFARHYDSQSERDAGMGTGWAHTYSHHLSEASTTTTIGDGTSSLSHLLSTWYEDRRAQVIYLARELDGPGKLTGLSLEVSETPSLTLGNWTIRVKHTSLDSYTNPQWQSSGWTTVFQANTVISETGWNHFEFATPFAYNGIDNLLVDFSFNNSSWGADRGRSLHTDVGAVRMIHAYVDSTHDDPLNWSGTVPPPYTTSLVPNIRLSTAATAWTDDLGRQFIFLQDGSGGYVTDRRLHGVLTQTAGGHTYRDKNGFVHAFDSAGRLIELRDRNGNSLSVAYDANGHITTVTDSNDPARQLNFAYTGDHITSIADFGGRTWTYSYASGHLMQVVSPSDEQTPEAIVQYDYYPDTDAALGGLLRRIAEPDGGVRSYQYYPNRRGFSVTDPEGDTEYLQYNLYRQQTTYLNPRGKPTVFEYDDAGQVTRMIHPDGTSESYTWGAALMTSWTDPMGHRETYAYDSRGNLLELTDRSGVLTTFEYEPTYSQVTRMTRPGGRITTFDYDDRGNLTQVTDPLGNATTMTYDAHGLLLTRTRPKGGLTPDPADYTTTYTYNTAGQVLSESTDLPSIVSYQYDPLGNRIAETDPNGNTTAYRYDARNRLVEITDPLDNTRTFSYDAAGRLLTATDALGHVVNMHYDLKGNRLRRIHPDGTFISFGYDPADNQAWQADELGQATHFVYSPRDQVVQIRLPDGGSTRLRYAGGERLAALTDALGNETRFAYDAEGRLLEMIDALGNAVTNTYDEAGNLETITDRRGGVTTYSYDLLNRLTQMRGEGDVVFTADYDANSNPMEIVRYDVTGLDPIPDDPRTLPDSRKRIFQTVYDVLNRPVAQIDPLGSSTSTAYDPGGRVIRTTDERGESIEYRYDSADNLTTRTNPDGGIVQFHYDEVYRRIGLTMPEGGLWQWKYDSRGRTTAETDPLGRRTTFHHDAVDAVLQQLNPDGSWIRYVRDARNRLTERSRSDGSFDQFAYDLNGNMALARNEHSDVELTYDALNRRTGETTTMTDGQPWSVSSWTVSYAYDPEGNIVQTTDTWGTTVEYTFDLAGRLASLTSSRGESAAIAYNGYGQRETITYGNGRVDSLTYDDKGQLSGITFGGPGSVSWISYDRDAAGAPITISENLDGAAETLTIRRDAMGRPVWVNAASNPLRSESFSYDRNGNLIDTGAVTGCTFDAADQLLASSEGTYEYDARGNLTVTHKLDGSRVETVHDASNRIVVLRDYDGAGKVVREVAYLYDAIGRRIKAIDEGQETHRTFAFQNMINTVDPNTVVHYLVGSDLDDVFAANVDLESRYVHRDVIGTVRIVSDITGAVTGTDSYSLFGRLVTSTGIQNTGLGFTARPADLGMSVIDLRARMYRSILARFLSRDPVVAYPLGICAYAYSSNNPLVFVDPFGFSPEKPWWQKAWEWYAYESVVPGPFGQPVSEWGQKGSTEWGNLFKYTEEAGGAWMWSQRLAYGTAVGAMAIAVGVMCYDVVTGIRIEFHLPHPGPHSYPHIQGIQQGSNPIPWVQKGLPWGKTVWRFP